MQLYKVKIDHTELDADKDGFLMSFGETAQYTRGEAIKKAKMFNGRIIKSENHEQGMCPKCNETNLEFEDREITDNALTWNFTCPDCGFRGYESYSMIFTGHTEQTYFNKTT